MFSNTKGIYEIIHFLRRNYQNVEENLLRMIDLTNNGYYFINENTVFFSEVASKMLNVEQEIHLEDFLDKINEEDREQFSSVHSSYELTYRYHFMNDQMVWIKEHGLFDFKNKNQRLAVISKQTLPSEEQSLYRLAYYDRLTNVKNRNYFEKDATYLIHYHIPFALFFIDLNRFKLINDHYGHTLGDIVLNKFAEKLKASIPSQYQFDLYRISGDEFYLLFPYLSDYLETEAIVNAILSSFEHDLIIENYKIVVSPSIGITFFPKDTNHLQTLIKYADISMYKAKLNGYSSYSFFDPSFYEQVIEDESIEEHINELIDKQQITLSYQPIYHVSTHQIVSFEALFNSQSNYTPDQIFKVALKSHLIVVLDQFIIETVIKNISEHKQHLPDSIRFTINVTPKTFYYEDLYESIIRLLDKYQVDGKRLGIELTEQYYINDEKKLNDKLTKLQSLGIHIYLDDFGMGYSSIRNLFYLTYNHIKIDKRMISSLFINKKCESFLKKILEFSQEFNCHVIFEGIETQEQLDYVKKIGGNFVQGYYYSKAIPIHEAIKKL